MALCVLIQKGNIKSMSILNDVVKKLSRNTITYLSLNFIENFLLDYNITFFSPKVSNGYAQLTSQQLLARDMIILLQENGFQILLNTFGNLFQQKYGIPLCVTDYGFKSMTSMLEHFPEYFIISKGKKQKRFVCLNSETSGKI